MILESSKMEEEKKKTEETEKVKKEAVENRLRAADKKVANIPLTGIMKYSKRALINEMIEGKSFDFHPFYGHKVEDPVSDYCFSNWYPCTFVVDGVTYHTTEQYMMAHKALVFGDQAIYEEIMSVDDPKQYKALGRTVRNFDSVTWNRHKYGIVLEGCKAKLSQNPEFAKVLLGTGDEVIVEAAPRDVIRGVDLGKENEKIKDPSLWRGTNLLGFILMEVRDYLRSSD